VTRSHFDPKDLELFFSSPLVTTFKHIPHPLHVRPVPPPPKEMYLKPKSQGLNPAQTVDVSPEGYKQPEQEPHKALGLDELSQIPTHPSTVVEAAGAGTRVKPRDALEHMYSPVDLHFEWKVDEEFATRRSRKLTLLGYSLFVGAVPNAIHFLEASKNAAMFKHSKISTLAEMDYDRESWATGWTANLEMLKRQAEWATRIWVTRATAPRI